ncbi:MULTISPECIES: hypothetical protein [Bacillus]|uniref:Uncharacterized protein n=1 Tax=Bacillus glycinifermentans TaxID=1664069 RepID=A0A0T6BIP5_9BACI|nr:MULTISPECIES: hypothetical protein [Bacillus]KRT87136.1 hypothetical protein AB447_209220 [Bacillus glycinifermentans]MEC0341974.1 hypothetical protein [Bacillus sonorensis]MEC0457512.1 hypothetical protein [Bacillus sonorensis]MEC0487188.1 hypothetical protein [Bacillus glycinifermentans]MEC0530693.1 hypothetical protein [Bacillus sonorensis]
MTTAIVTFNIKGTEIKTKGRVPKVSRLKDDAKKAMTVLNAINDLKRELGIDVFKLLNGECYDDIRDSVQIKF